METTTVLGTVRTGGSSKFSTASKLYLDTVFNFHVIRVFSNSLKNRGLCDIVMKENHQDEN